MKGKESTNEMVNPVVSSATPFNSASCKKEIKYSLKGSGMGSGLEIKVSSSLHAAVITRVIKTIRIKNLGIG